MTPQEPHPQPPAWKDEWDNEEPEALHTPAPAQQRIEQVMQELGEAKHSNDVGCRDAVDEHIDEAIALLRKGDGG